MAGFKVRAPDGQILQISAPDQQSALAIASRTWRPTAASSPASRPAAAAPPRLQQQASKYLDRAYDIGDLDPTGISGGLLAVSKFVGDHVPALKGWLPDADSAHQFGRQATGGLLDMAIAGEAAGGQAIHNLASGDKTASAGDAYNAVRAAQADRTRRYASPANTMAGVAGGLSTLALGAAGAPVKVAQGARAAGAMAALRAAAPRLAKTVTAGAALGGVAGAANAPRWQDIPRDARTGAEFGAVVAPLAPAAVRGVQMIGGAGRRLLGGASATAASLKNLVTGAPEPVDLSEASPTVDRFLSDRDAAAAAAHADATGAARAPPPPSSPPKMTAPEKQALAYVRQKLQAKGIPEDALVDRPLGGRGYKGASGGPGGPITAGDMVPRGITAGEAMGPSMVSEMVSLARRPGLMADEAFDQFGTRGRQLPNRQIGDIEQHLGVSPDLARSGVDALVAKGRADVKPMFDQALSGSAPIWNDELANLAQRPSIKKAIAAALSSYHDAGVNVSSPGIAIDGDTGAPLIGQDMKSLIELQPTAQAWDLVRAKVNGLVKKDPHSGEIIRHGPAWQENANIMQAGSDLSGALRTAIPAPYSDGLDRSGDYLKVQDAADRAKNMLFGPASQRWTPLKVADYYAGLGTEPERQAMKNAFASQLYDKAENADLYQGDIKGVGGADRGALRHKLAIVFSPDAADGLLSSLNADFAMQRSGSRIAPMTNSTTGEVQQAAREHDAAAGVDLAKHIVTGNPAAALKSVVLAPLDGARAPGAIEFRDALSALTLMSPDELQAYLAANPGPGSLLPPGMARSAGSSAALLSPQNQQ